MGNDGNQLSPDEVGTSKNGRGLLKVPSRSSSQQRNQASTASTGLSGATVADPRSSIDGRSKESRSSVPGRQRNGSASTHRTGGDSERGQAARTSQPSSPSTSEQKRKRKKNGGLLSLLGCCGVPDAANTLEEGDNENVHKVEKLPQRPATAKSRQPATQEQQPGTGKPLNEKDTAQSGSSPDHIENQASSSTQEPASTAERSNNEPQEQTAPSAVAIDSPPHPAANEVETGEHVDTRDNVDVDMPDVGQEESHDAVPPDSSADPQPHAIPPPPSGPGPAAVSLPPLTDSGLSAPDQQSWLLPPIAPEHKGRKCLVLDLDETLVHSSFKILHQADFTIPVEIEGNYHNVYVIKRPGVDEFMKRVGELYEVVVFTASVSKYGDPLLDQLDIHRVIHHRLFRESCYNHQGNYVKDLSQIGRELKDTIIIDNSPTSYIFHPQHAVPISSWFSDAHDNELLDLIPVLEDLAGPNVTDVSLVLDVTL
ncbi:hypothetical protein QQS21_003215 [Conoideocrella luteorostrata]|uniref:FCP1 homology domain-containing protein n=1 Tax=Conoideocrella luteorostrata TaxID=1105319 RepID=A0AAJ0G2F3_9HYPO|nr:hypothetical protein QQS21_003215 [Conoideocrella luteorostrata]